MGSFKDVVGHRDVIQYLRMQLPRIGYHRRTL